MMRHIFMLAIVIALGCCLAKAEDLVGSLASPDRLVFHGCKLVKESEIRRAVESDWQIQLAAAPSMPLNGYLYTLQKRLREGFLASGFSQPKVSADLEGGADGHVVVSVDEGPRYFCGGIRVTGKTGDIPIDRLIDFLTRPVLVGNFSGEFKDPRTYFVGTELTQKRSDPKWITGDPAPFGSDARDGLDSDVQTALQHLGYFATRIQISVETTANGKAVLHIDIVDTGHPTHLDRVEVVGNKISKTADIQKLIGLVPGQSIGIGDLLEAQRRLWESGHFYKHLLTATSIADEKWTRLTLKVDLGEITGLPPLDQPLSEADQALLRCRQWLMDGPKLGDDLVFDLRPLRVDNQPRTTGKLFFGAEGSAFQLRQTMPPMAIGARNSSTIEYAGALTPTMAGLFAVTDQQKVLASAPKQFCWVVFFSYGPSGDASEKTKWATNLGASFDSSRSAKPGAQLSMSIAPAAVLHMAHEKDIRSRIENGKLLIDGEEIHLRAEVATGRIEQCQVTGDGYLLDVSRRQGALAQEIAELEKTGGNANLYDPRRPAASIAAFVADQALRSPWLHPGNASPEARGKAVAGKLLGPDIFEAFDRFMASFPDRGSTFSIPFARWSKSTGIVATSATFLLPYVNDFFEHGSWPWTLSRQGLLVLAQHPESFEPELRRIVSDDRMGPIGFFAAAKFLQPYSPLTATALAAFGVGRLDARHFQTDIDAFTTGNSIVPQSVRQVAQRLRELSDADMDALATVVPPEVAKVLRQFRTALRARANEPIEKALPDVLQQLWADSYQNLVGTALHQIADGH